jgi:hypothetical protein
MFLEKSFKRPKGEKYALTIPEGIFPNNIPKLK